MSVILLAYLLHPCEGTFCQNIKKVDRIRCGGCISPLHVDLNAYYSTRAISFERTEANCLPSVASTIFATSACFVGPATTTACFAAAVGAPKTIYRSAAVGYGHGRNIGRERSDWNERLNKSGSLNYCILLGTFHRNKDVASRVTNDMHMVRAHRDERIYRVELPPTDRIFAVRMVLRKLSLRFPATTTTTVTALSVTAVRPLTIPLLYCNSPS